LLTNRGAISPFIVFYMNELDQELIRRQHEAFAKAADTDAFDWRSGLDSSALPFAISTETKTLLVNETLIKTALSKGDNPSALAEVCACACGGVVTRGLTYDGAMLTDAGSCVVETLPCLFSNHGCCASQLGRCGHAQFVQPFCGAFGLELFVMETNSFLHRRRSSWKSTCWLTTNSRNAAFVTCSLVLASRKW
jgi:hypothetical protein